MLNGGNEFLRNVGYPIMLALILAIAAFTSSRAGHEDLSRVERIGEEREAHILREIEKVEETVSRLKAKVHQSEVDQAAFRAQVRAALRISEEQ